MDAAWAILHRILYRTAKPQRSCLLRPRAYLAAVRGNREPADLLLGRIVEPEQPVRLGDRRLIADERGERGTLASTMLQPVHDHFRRRWKCAPVSAAASQV